MVPTTDACTCTRKKENERRKSQISCDDEIEWSQMVMFFSFKYEKKEQ